jgi:hypothetical protein
MKRALILVAAALMIPSVALAKGNPGHGHQGGKSAPKVAYILKGTLSAYTAATDSSPGSITIAVTRSNHHGKALKGQTLTFPTDSKTKISLENGVTSIADNDKGIVKVRAPKKIAAADLASTLQTYTARQIVDQGASS